MSNYRRLISYIYAYEGGVKGKNIGFAKIETRGVQCKITVSVKKVYVGGNDIGVYLLAGEDELYLGNIFIRGGSGEFRTSVSADDVEHTGVNMDQCFGLTIHDVKNTWRSYTTIWEDAVAHAAEVDLEGAALKAKEEGVAKISEALIQKAVKEIEEEFPLVPQQKEGLIIPQEETGQENNRESVDSVKAAIHIESGPNPLEPEEKPPIQPEQKPQVQMDQPEEEPVLRGFPGIGQSQAKPLEAEAFEEERPDIENRDLQETETAVMEEKLYESINEEDCKENNAEAGAEAERITQEWFMREAKREAALATETKKEPYQDNSNSPIPEITVCYRADAMGQAKPGIAMSFSQEAPERTEPKLGDPQALERFIQQEELEEGTHDMIWEKLKREHTRILAFDYEKGCEILTIKPQDIGLLPREEWVYGNNSFLLHGYYNYRYLILARLNNPKGSPRYLLGVPGHFYSNERYMASMFGFPNFVLSKEQPIGDGRFGYWYTDIKMRA